MYRRRVGLDSIRDVRDVFTNTLGLRFAFLPVISNSASRLHLDLLTTTLR